MGEPPEHSSDTHMESLLKPVAPHDAFSFEQLASSYNYGQTGDRRAVFVRLLRDELCKRSRPIRVLDIGCGTGISEEAGVNEQYLRGVRACTDELWGIEPDQSVDPKHELIDHFQHATLETARLPEAYFDLAYSYFVMEHVADPAAFLRSVYRALKPGGIYMFITPNAGHYFTKIAGMLRRLRLDEQVLRLARGKAVDQYHYPVEYRCNSPKRIGQIAGAVGFAEPEFAFIEQFGPRPYFPGPTVMLFKLLCWKRRVIHNQHALLELLCRVRRPI